MRYAVRFYNNNECVKTIYGNAKDEYDAETKAGFYMMFNYPNTKFNRVEITKEGK